MLKLRLIAVGSLKEAYWRDAQAEFLKRLAPYAKVEIVEIEAEPITKTVAKAVSMKREGERILRVLSEKEHIIALDKGGKEFDSPALASYIYNVGGAGEALTFVIGGAAGLTSDVLNRAQTKISLSKLTFTHEMARVFFLEQIYRAAMIQAGKAYHY
jgi:23S rRNA (pseudouridine1915-N3)-methyltransferase